MEMPNKHHAGLHNLRLHRHHRLYNQQISVGTGHLLHPTYSPQDQYREIRSHVWGHTEVLDDATLEGVTTPMMIPQMDAVAAVGVMVGGADLGEEMEAEEMMMGTMDPTMVAVDQAAVDEAEILAGSVTSCGVCGSIRRSTLPAREPSV
ncbi:MAG: hypothetical protein Pars2KO_33350 [Parasphingorhabdus sp.]